MEPWMEFLTVVFALGLLSGLLGWGWDAVRALVRDRNPLLLLLGIWLLAPFILLPWAPRTPPGLVWFGLGLLGWLGGCLAITRFSFGVERHEGSRQGAFWFCDRQATARPASMQRPLAGTRPAPLAFRHQVITWDGKVIRLKRRCAAAETPRCAWCGEEVRLPHARMEIVCTQCGARIPPPSVARARQQKE
jgi:hypothetical protein